MSNRKSIPSEGKLEAFTTAFETFGRTIDRLESSYQELEERFSNLNSQLEETNQRLREALLENEKARSFLDNILSSVSSGILVYDRNGKISHHNAAAEELLGLDSHSIHGLSGGDLFKADTKPEISALSTLETGEEFRSEEKTLTLTTGEELPVAVSTALMRDYSGEVIGVVEVLHDLRKIRLLEEEITRVQALAALGEIAATIAHEVRNPLGGIVGFASLLKRDLPEDHPGQRMVDKIITGVDNLNNSVSSLLMYARDISLSPREVELRNFMEEIVTYFSADINHDSGKYNISTELNPMDISWRLDPEQFRQAIVNLLYNAVQAMPDGGDIRLSARVNDELQVEVSDSGPGIKEKDRERIFTPFFTTKEGGTGLGLATVKKIVDAHRGKIDVITEPGEGTCFKLVFPR